MKISNTDIDEIIFETVINFEVFRLPLSDVPTSEPNAYFGTQSTTEAPKTLKQEKKSNGINRKANNGFICNSLLKFRPPVTFPIDLLSAPPNQHQQHYPLYQKQKYTKTSPNITFFLLLISHTFSSSYSVSVSVRLSYSSTSTNG